MYDKLYKPAPTKTRIESNTPTDIREIIYQKTLQLRLPDIVGRPVILCYYYYYTYS